VLTKKEKKKNVGEVAVTLVIIAPYFCVGKETIMQVYHPLNGGDFTYLQK